MISYSPPGPSIERIGAVDPLLQADFSLSLNAGTRSLVLSVSGPREKVVALAASAAYDIGAMSLPPEAGSIALRGGVKIILDDVSVSGAPGAVATLRATFRQRTVRETDADVEKGLQSRTISCQWIERQEFIEHWAARKASAARPFNASLFAAWMQEADPAAKAEYKVTRGAGDLVALDDGSGSGAWKGSQFTKAVAQRYAMGVQYAAVHQLQVVVREQWRTAPQISAKCNVIICVVPAEHRPINAIEGFDDFTWMLVGDSVENRVGGLFERTVLYLGLPSSLSPATPPLLWGNGPIDKMLYTEDSP